ncbi:MAG TPA: ThiF family adenylyltransferase [Candidatus Eremiobacteraceae bacterium]|nr:ThiF family adenylyltransferase [Candidatus Eremiobacteraceae bacterium]
MIDASRLTFLGIAGLRRLRESTICVVGLGGGGSHVAQQLAHLAVGRLILIDADRLEASNVNRVVGSSYRDVGDEKVRVMARRLDGLGGLVEPVAKRAEDSDAQAAIESSDLVVGALDSFRARDNLEKRCRAALVAYVDIGLTIVVDDSGVVGAVGGQVASSLPGGPCLRCMHIVTDDSLAGDREEYVAGAPEQQVISMNGLLASQAVNTALALITGYGRDHRPPLYLVYDGLRHELRRHPFYPETHVCPHYDVADAGRRIQLPPRRPS